MTAPATSMALATLTSKLAATLDMGDGTGLMETLKATAFRTKADGPQVGDAQMTALLIIANQYGLNPWTKEIYAFPDKNNGIVPVVGVDGWSRIINKHAQFDGIEFEQDEHRCTCTIYRKDRSHPTVVTEYMVECFREGVGPWKSHPYRMLRHKAMIQCARLAFGFVGIYEQDEAERIVDATPPAATTPTIKHMGAAEEVRPAANAEAQLPAFPDADFQRGLPVWKKAAAKLPVSEVLARAQAANPGFAFTEVQKASILSLKGEAGPTFASIADALDKAQGAEALALAGDLIKSVADEKQRAELQAKFDEREAALTVEG